MMKSFIISTTIQRENYSMKILVSTQDIGRALQTAGLHPCIKQVNCYGVHRGGDDYEPIVELNMQKAS